MRRDPVNLRDGPLCRRTHRRRNVPGCSPTPSGIPMGSRIEQPGSRYRSGPRQPGATSPSCRAPPRFATPVRYAVRTGGLGARIRCSSRVGRPVAAGRTRKDSGTPWLPRAPAGKCSWLLLPTTVASHVANSCVISTRAEEPPEDRDRSPRVRPLLRRRLTRRRDADVRGVGQDAPISEHDPTFPGGLRDIHG